MRFGKFLIRENFCNEAYLRCGKAFPAAAGKGFFVFFLREAFGKSCREERVNAAFRKKRGTALMSWQKRRALAGESSKGCQRPDANFRRGVISMNGMYKIIRIQEHPELVNAAAEWFHQKWAYPVEAYADSMKECLQRETDVPQWYVVMDGCKIIAGLGVIENDFHDRKDLTPNVSSVFVEEEYRRRGIAGKMLQFVCDEFAMRGINTLFLVTDHTSFYERYGWRFLCMVQGDGEPEMTRLYQHEMAGAAAGCAKRL